MVIACIIKVVGASDRVANILVLQLKKRERVEYNMAVKEKSYCTLCLNNMNENEILCPFCFSTGRVNAGVQPPMSLF